MPLLLHNVSTSPLQEVHWKRPIPSGRKPDAASWRRCSSEAAAYSKEIAPVALSKEMRPERRIYEFLDLHSHLNMVLWRCPALTRLFFDNLQSGKRAKAERVGCSRRRQPRGMLRFCGGSEEKRRDASSTVVADTEQHKSGPLCGLSRRCFPACGQRRIESTQVVDFHDNFSYSQVFF